MKVFEEKDLINQRLIDAGYSALSVYSIRFDRCFTEEEKAENRRAAETLTKKQWSVRCDEFSKSLEPRMQEVLDCLDGKYDIHQTRPENSGMDHFRSNWDLFFYTNKGAEGHPYLDYFQLTFNKNRTPEENLELLAEIREIIEPMDVKNVCCIVRYTNVYDDQKLYEDAAEYLGSLVDPKLFVCMGATAGRIRPVVEDGKPWYGFFPKGSRKRYYHISPKDAILWKLKKEREKEAV